MSRLLTFARFAEPTPAEEDALEAQQRERETLPAAFTLRRDALADCFIALGTAIKAFDSSSECNAAYSPAQDAVDDLARLSDMLTGIGR